MTKIILSFCAVSLLSGCGYWQDYNPFQTEQTPVAISAPAPIEKIGPDVIAVPVEPVLIQDMLNKDVQP